MNCPNTRCQCSKNIHSIATTFLKRHRHCHYQIRGHSNTSPTFLRHTTPSSNPTPFHFIFHFIFRCFIVLFSLSSFALHRFVSITNASRNNSVSQADYGRSPKSPHQSQQPSNGNGVPFKPVPPPKPKNYRPPVQGAGTQMNSSQWENGVCIPSR